MLQSITLYNLCIYLLKKKKGTYEISKCHVYRVLLDKTSRFAQKLTLADKTSSFFEDKLKHNKKIQKQENTFS